jgi:photosystem II stability/assembly factor-like uncharacterized protein
LLGIASLLASECFAESDISDIYAVATLDEQTTVALDARGRLLRTTDGSHFTVQSVTTSPIYGVSFALSTFGIAVGDSGTILSTTDGGASWAPQSSGTTNALLGVYVIDQNIAIAVGTNGTILRTEDGGQSWTPQFANAAVNLFGVSFADANNGIAVGDSGTILLTADGGQSWTTQPTGTTQSLANCFIHRCHHRHRGGRLWNHSALHRRRRHLGKREQQCNDAPGEWNIAGAFGGVLRGCQRGRRGR